VAALLDSSEIELGEKIVPTLHSPGKNAFLKLLFYN
jgi:hypothetical protein